MSQMPDWGGTALIIASTMGQADIVEALLDKGADPNAGIATVSPLCIRPCGIRTTERTRRKEPERWRPSRCFLRTVRTRMPVSIRKSPPCAP